jgi:hypothetical protein
MRGITSSSIPLKWAGPGLAALGALVIAIVLLGPVSERGPVGWWFVSEAFSFRRVLPLCGIGAALALLPRRACLAAFAAFSIGLTFGGRGVDALIASAVQVPGGELYFTLSSLISPVSFLAAGVALVSPRRVRPWLAPPAALVVGVAFASFIRITYPVFGDPGIVMAGVLFGIWLATTATLCLRRFRQPWFDTAGPILGSWCIGIAILDGGTALLR